MEAKGEDRFRSFLTEVGSLGYRMVYRLYDFQKMTGLLVCEGRIYVVGNLAGMEKQLELPTEPYGGYVSEENVRQFPEEDRENEEQLFYKAHAAVLRQLARTIQRYNAPENRQERNNARLKSLLGDYLSYRKFQYQKDCVDKMEEADFVVYDGKETICIATKLYTSHTGIESKVMRMCKRIRRYHEVYQGTCILATGNLVEDDIKQKCREIYHTYVWDVRNLLWLFREVPDIQNEFISLLNYTIENVVPEKPEPTLLMEHTGQREKATGIF